MKKQRMNIADPIDEGHQYPGIEYEGHLLPVLQFYTSPSAYVRVERREHAILVVSEESIRMLRRRLLIDRTKANLHV